VTAETLRRSRDLERIEWIRSRLAQTHLNETRLRSMLVIAHESLQRRLVDSGREAAARPPLAAIIRGRVEEIQDYQALVADVRAAAEAELPEGSRVLVVSRGDGDLLDLRGPTAGHFPQAPSGAWAGFYPADGEAALAHLKHLVAQGYEYLVFPSSSRWWLEYYTALAQDLESTCRLVHHGPACTIFELDAESRQEAGA
jgi:hypothetical protein